MRGPRFTGKVAVVTGGGSEIGAATARGLAAEGAKVVDVNAEAAQAVAAELPGAEARDRRRQRRGPGLRHPAAFGTVHVLVNSAG